jgi:hypothetical protein
MQCLYPERQGAAGVNVVSGTGYTRGSGWREYDHVYKQAGLHGRSRYSHPYLILETPSLHVTLRSQVKEGWGNGSDIENVRFSDVAAIIAYDAEQADR